MTVYAGMDRRTGKDRRLQGLPIAKRIFYRGMRQGLRRTEDRNRIIIFDQYQPSLLVATIAVLVLSLLDAALTLVLISQGATELNPVMNYYLNHGPTVFIFVKYGLTVLSVLFIILANEFLTTRFRLGSSILPLFAALFGGVVIWELYLLSL